MRIETRISGPRTGDLVASGGGSSQAPSSAVAVNRWQGVQSMVGPRVQLTDYSVTEGRTGWRGPSRPHPAGLIPAIETTRRLAYILMCFYTEMYPG
jgi:hypothetical protein